MVFLLRSSILWLTCTRGKIEALMELKEALKTLEVMVNIACREGKERKIEQSRHTKKPEKMERSRAPLYLPQLWPEGEDRHRRHQAH